MLRKLTLASPSLPSYVPPLPHRREPNGTPQADLMGQLEEQKYVTASLCFSGFCLCSLKITTKITASGCPKSKNLPSSNTPFLADSAHPYDLTSGWLSPGTCSPTLLLTQKPVHSQACHAGKSLEWAQQAASESHIPPSAATPRCPSSGHFVERIPLKEHISACRHTSHSKHKVGKGVSLLRSQTCHSQLNPPEKARFRLLGSMRKVG